MSASDEWQTAVSPGLPGAFRYLPLLGIGDETAELLADPEGAEVRRPIEAPDLARRLGVASMHLLPCDGGPSGTFKDAEAAVVIARQLERRGAAERIVFASSGNTARAYRGYALRAGIASTACVPAVGLEKLRGLRHDERSELIVVGDMLDATAVAAERGAAAGSRLIAPAGWRFDGKATIAYAIAEHVPRATVVAQTVAGGFGPLGMERGFERLARRGLLDRGPRFELFQVEGQASLASWLKSRAPIGVGDLELPADPFESTLLSVGPLRTAPELGRLVDTGRARVSVVPPARVEGEAAALADAAGAAVSYPAERSPFVSWAGLLARRAQLSRADHVVLILSGARAREGELPPVTRLDPGRRSGDHPGRFADPAPSAV